MTCWIEYRSSSDLSYLFDPYGHPASWLNSFSFPPSYFHNIIVASTHHPVIYLDVQPFRQEVFNTLELVSASFLVGCKPVHKWVYRATIHVTPRSPGAHKGWAGQVVMEAEGTLLGVQDLLKRCAGPAASAQDTKELIMWALDDNPVPGDQKPKLYHQPAVHDPRTRERLPTTSPWAILRERSRPGLIYLAPVLAS